MMELFKSIFLIGGLKRICQTALFNSTTYWLGLVGW